MENTFLTGQWLGELPAPLGGWLQSPQLPGIVLVAMTALAAAALARGHWLRTQRRRQVQSTLDGLPDAVALFDEEGRLQAANGKLLALLPLQPSERELEESTRDDFQAQLSTDPIASESARARARELLTDPDATLSYEVPGEHSIPMMFKEKRTAQGGLSLTVRQVTRAAPSQQDPLTALPNRHRLFHELAERCSRTADQLALILVDLRGFRQINDSFGSASGDELLKQVALTLQHCMPEDALIARTAGDEFAVLIEFDRDRAGIERRVQAFLSALRCGLRVQEQVLPVRACVGIAYAPIHGNTVSTLLKSADSACAYAKRLGNNSLVVYSPDQQAEAKRRHLLEVGLLQAVRKNELHLQYQPQVDIRTRMTSGMEALLRWNSEELGQVSPAEFIPVAEETGIITRIGHWVMRQAIMDYQGLDQFGMAPPKLSVNLSRRQFDSGDIVRDLTKLFAQTGFDPRRLVLEITETALFNDSRHLRRQLDHLTAMGIRLAIDDFGVGYSSLLELRDFPISEVKIDRAFVMNVHEDDDSREIIRAIVNIADAIGAEVVAEGIENQAQLDAIAELGCHRAQGFFLCKPMSATTFPDVMLSA